MDLSNAIDYLTGNYQELQAFWMAFDLSNVIAYLTGNFKYAQELQAFWMAFQGCIAVRSGVNKDGKLYWFHAFMLSVFTAFAGGTFGSLWMAKPTSMLSNDVNVACCIIAFAVASYAPFDIGYKLGKTFPVVIVTTVFAQLFRTCGLVKFSTVAFEAFKDNPSEYYPIPIFGPIIYATMLGNMGGFFLKGLNGHLKDGMPWPFQTGLACASFYHFYVHDETGFIGVNLRHCFHLVFDDLLKMSGLYTLDRKTLAFVTISAFQHVMAILQLPYFLGPKASPFNAAYYFASEEAPTNSKAIPAKPKTLDNKQESSSSTATKESTVPQNGNHEIKKKKKKQKKGSQQKQKEL